MGIWEVKELLKAGEIMNFEDIMKTQDCSRETAYKWMSRLQKHHKEINETFKEVTRANGRRYMLKYLYI